MKDGEMAKDFIHEGHKTVLEAEFDGGEEQIAQ